MMRSLFHLPHLKLYVGKERTVLCCYVSLCGYYEENNLLCSYFSYHFMFCNQTKTTDGLCCRRTHLWTQRDFTLLGRLWWIIVASASLLRRSFLDYWRKTRSKVSSMALMTTEKQFLHTPGNKQTIKVQFRYLDFDQVQT